ncbi:MAG: hypothetical protein AAF600_01685 [Bacteroidota bacterium]
MKTSQSELLWQGKTHLGDEPGIFSDADYSGLSFEAPITIKSHSGSAQEVSIIITSELVKVFQGYPGHKVTITQFTLDSSTGNPYDYKETILVEERITDSNAAKEVKFKIQGNENFASCKIEVDTTVAPGLYDDFLITGLNFKSDNYQYYASFGFR